MTARCANISKGQALVTSPTLVHTGWRAKVKPAPDREVNGRNEPEGEVQKMALTAFRRYKQQR